VWQDVQAKATLTALADKLGTGVGKVTLCEKGYSACFNLVQLFSCVCLHFQATGMQHQMFNKTTQHRGERGGGVDERVHLQVRRTLEDHPIGRHNMKEAHVGGGGGKRGE